MMGYKHSRDEILAAAVAEALEGGIGTLSFGRVAKRLGIPDRTVVYYFKNKSLLIQAVFEAQSAQLNTVLLQAFDRPARGHVDLLRMAWPFVASETADPILRQFLEMLGLCVRGVSPFAQMVPPAIASWIELLMQLQEGPESVRRAEAEAAIAMIDGLLLLRHAAGPEVADRAAHLLMKAG